MALVQINWNPPRRQLRWFGLAGVAVFGVVGAVIFFTHRIFWFELSAPAARATGWALWAVAAGCGVLAPTVPAALRPLYVGLSIVALPIGLVVSHVLLGVVFYAAITPLALLFRLIGRDALHRRLDPDAKTYWTPREEARDIKRYFRQF
ncbi:hypothetical protein LCGC14_1969970 [marine sediment metagenome]|uniref:Uncharacterized protein n=1 Tax=marine sediment metagenome TaxID=412755 RepID=A0A0F9HQF1_9ZZZZ